MAKKRTKARKRQSRKLAIYELAIAGVILAASATGLYVSTRGDSPIVYADGNEFKVQIADDNAERKLGLSGQDALANDEGMIFIFEESDRHGFWMKDMKFSIDILWIDENFRIVHMEEKVSPDTFPESFIPNVDARYVLEIYTGQAEAQGIDLGEEVIFYL